MTQQQQQWRNDDGEGRWERGQARGKGDDNTGPIKHPQPLPWAIAHGVERGAMWVVWARDGEGDGGEEGDEGHLHPAPPPWATACRVVMACKCMGIVRKTLKLNSLFLFIYFCPREPKRNSKCSQTDCGNNISHACNYSIVYVPVHAHPCSTIKYSKIYVT